MLPLLISYYLQEHFTSILCTWYNDTEMVLYSPVQYSNIPQILKILSTPFIHALLKVTSLHFYSVYRRNISEWYNFNLTNLHSCQNLWILKDVTQSRGSSRYVSSRHASWEPTKWFPCLLLLLGLQIIITLLNHNCIHRYLQFLTPTNHSSYKVDISL